MDGDRMSTSAATGRGDWISTTSSGEQVGFEQRRGGVEELEDLLESAVRRDAQATSSDVMLTTQCHQVFLPDLPVYLIEDILNRLEDARYITRAQGVSRDWRCAGYNNRSFRVIVLDVYHERARDTISGKSSEPDGAGPSTSGSVQPKSGRRWDGSYKDLFLEIVKNRKFLVQLRIEVEPKLQSKTVPDGERRRTDFWLSDPWFVRQWLPGMGSTLQHLCIVDYGQQAIMRRSSIIKILSMTCRLMKTLDLRNMFIDTNDCEEMTLMVSLTLRCVKVVGGTLQHINDKMSKLQTLALLGVFGADGGNLAFQDMKVLCLGLSTPAKDVVMNLPNLEKLQLKMQCPEKLIIEAPRLKYVAFNLEVLEPSKVDLKSMVGLEELLYGATAFATLGDLVGKNIPHLKKLFLDIPCMALGEDGRFLGVLKDVILQLPSFSRLRLCENLTLLNIGPGLWHSMEIQVETIRIEESWPNIQTLIVHMIPHRLESVMTVLRTLIRPSVTNLTIFIHTSSPVTLELLKPRIVEIAAGQYIVPLIEPWTKSLDFSCFSF